jgi:hypothetical protein
MMSLNYRKIKNQFDIRVVNLPTVSNQNVRLLSVPRHVMADESHKVVGDGEWPQVSPKSQRSPPFLSIRASSWHW